MTAIDIGEQVPSECVHSNAEVCQVDLTVESLDLVITKSQPTQSARGLVVTCRLELALQCLGNGIRSPSRMNYLM